MYLAKLFNLFIKKDAKNNPQLTAKVFFFFCRFADEKIHFLSFYI